MAFTNPDTAEAAMNKANDIASKFDMSHNVNEAVV
jgi:hypothetical protein